MNLKKNVFFIITFIILLLGFVSPLLHPSALIGDNFKTEQNSVDSTAKLDAIENYNMYTIPYVEYDAHINGYELGVIGDDEFAMVPLPFPFPFYDFYYGMIFVSSNGYLSFTDPMPVEWDNPMFPTPFYTNIIAPFWADLEAFNNIFVWETPEFVVIEYYNYNYAGGEPVGTFSVFLSNTGEIIFFYKQIEIHYFATVGLNYGFDLFYYTQYLDDLTGQNDFALQFTTETIPSRSITILEPTGSQTVAGGSAFVSFTVSEEINLNTVDIYVNSEFIATTNYVGINELFVPVFQNGTNVIELFASWGDGTDAIDAVSINSVDVIPVYPVKLGDFYHLKGTLLGTTEYMDYNYTFYEWLEPFVINVTGNFRIYDDIGTIAIMEEWFAINVLNGYTHYEGEGFMNLVTTRFMGFSCFVCPETTGTYPSIGDKTIFGIWNDIFTITGSVLWKYTDVWVLGNIDGHTIYVEKSTQLLTYFHLPGVIDLELIYTSLDCTNPMVSSPADIEYGIGDTGNLITWSATDMNPLTYTLYEDDIEITSDIWQPAIGIEVNVDGRAEGSYEFKIVFMDAGGNSAEDIVIVTVVPVIPEINALYYPLFLSTLVLMIYTSIIYRKLKPSKN